MGTEVAMSFSALRAQLENERSSLYKIDENIKKIVQTSGRYSDRFNNTSGDYGRGGARSGRNSYPDTGNNYNRNDELFGNKRKHETKTVFSRLSARNIDSDNEEEEEVRENKRARMHSTVTRDMPTRAAVVRAQSGDAQARTRNRRMFGSLLGTLQKFKQEEISLQTKEDKKAQVERKIEEQARQQKEREQLERKTLFAEREHKKATIKALEVKMNRVQEFEQWETSQKSLGHFILTRTKPHLYWLPKKMSDAAQEKLNTSRKFHEKIMSKKREELEEELQRIEQRCARRGPAAKENQPAHPDLTEHQESEQTERGAQQPAEGEEASKRNKFAMEGDEKDKEESDAEEHVNENAAGDNKEDHEMDTTAATDATELDNTLTERDDSITEKDNSITERDNSITEKDDSITEKDNSITEKDNSITEKDNSITEKDNSITEKDSSIAEKDSSITEKDNSITVQANGNTTQDIQDSQISIDTSALDVTAATENGTHDTD